jgi:cytochrome d ubiquinol oxidase subunit II
LRRSVSFQQLAAEHPVDDGGVRDHNRGRNKTDPEYELLDTGIFNEDRYFDLFVEYAKAAPTDMLIEISIANRGPAEAEIHVLPTLWFRNFWTWWPEETKPSLRDASQRGITTIAATDAVIGDYFLYCDGRPLLLFTENETNNQRLFGSANPTPYVKDGINDYVVADRQNAVNPNNTGTKSAAHYRLRVGAGATAVIRLRLRNAAVAEPFGAGFAQILETRRREADDFYRSITPAGVGEDAANVMRQALAGMLWSKQYFFYDVNKCLQEHRVDPRRPTGQVRNQEWFHMISGHVISMPEQMGISLVCRLGSGLSHHCGRGLCGDLFVRLLLHLSGVAGRAGGRGAGRSAGTGTGDRIAGRGMSAVEPSGLALFWAGVIALAILVYVILDGFDLGVGILFGTTRDRALRDEMMAAISPFWDGNETWLVIVGASLFGAFPMVYAVFLPAFYIPVLLLLLALIFRGVAFEFRYGVGGRVLWDRGFSVGSTVAAFVQGAAVGAMIRGIPVVGNQYAGGPFDWLRPLPVVTGIGLVLGYALLGAGWLNLKSEGSLRDWAWRRIPWLAGAVLVVLGIAVVAAFIERARVTGNLFVGRPWGFIFPAVGLLAMYGVFAAARRRRDGWPFALTAVFFVSALLSLAVMFWPYMIPYSVTVGSAAAPEKTLSFLFWGAGA